jgi:carbohydrate-selective porin OprB
LGWDIWSFLSIVFIPILFSLVLSLSFYWKTPSLRVSTAIVVLIIGMITVPMAKNAKLVFVTRLNQAVTHQLFYPFSAFPGQISYSPAMRMYVSMDAWEAVGRASYIKDRSELSALFNIYFSARSLKANFDLVSDPENIPADLLSTRYDFVLLSSDDWKTIQQAPDLAAVLEQQYQVFQEGTGRLVLLKPE